MVGVVFVMDGGCVAARKLYGVGVSVAFLFPPFFFVGDSATTAFYALFFHAGLLLCATLNESD